MPLKKGPKMISTWECIVEGNAVRCVTKALQSYSAVAKEDIITLQQRCYDLEHRVASFIETNQRLKVEIDELKTENIYLADLVEQLNRRLSHHLTPEKLKELTQEIKEKATAGETRYLENLRKECIEKHIPLIRYYRIMQNLTQKELADKIGVQQSHISRWESKEGINPGIENLKRLAQALNVTMDDLCGLRGN